MNWFKQNPFIGLLSLVAGLFLLGAAYFLFDSHGRYTAEVAAYEEQKLSLGRLQGNKPFPSEENVRLTQEELDSARSVLAEIGQSFAVTVPSVTPQEFQDLLREKVNDITSRATANGVALGESFYLGFEAYETQPPPAAAAGPLALQLESVHAVAGILVEAGVKEITGVSRSPLAAEASAPAKEDGDKEPRRPGEKESGDAAAAKGALPDLVLAPFDVRFIAEQAAFRAAFNRVLESEPPVFLRLLAVTNTAPAGPSKTAAADEDSGAGAIKPVLGQEFAVVNLRLAAVSTGIGESD
jgi:hypothetical protein